MWECVITILSKEIFTSVFFFWIKDIWTSFVPIDICCEYFSTGIKSYKALLPLVFSVLAELKNTHCPKSWIFVHRSFFRCFFSKRGVLDNRVLIYFLSVEPPLFLFELRPDALQRLSIILKDLLKDSCGFILLIVDDLVGQLDENTFVVFGFLPVYSVSHGWNF